MSEFMDEAKKLASEHSDLAKEKTGGKYDEHIETAEDKLEGFLGMNTEDDNR